MGRKFDFSVLNILQENILLEQYLFVKIEKLLKIDIFDLFNEFSIIFLSIKNCYIIILYGYLLFSYQFSYILGWEDCVDECVCVFFY